MSEYRALLERIRESVGNENYERLVESAGGEKQLAQFAAQMQTASPTKQQPFQLSDIGCAGWLLIVTMAGGILVGMGAILFDPHVSSQFESTLIRVLLIPFAGIVGGGYAFLAIAGGWEGAESVVWSFWDLLGYLRGWLWAFALLLLIIEGISIIQGFVTLPVPSMEAEVISISAGVLVGGIIGRWGAVRRNRMLGFLSIIYTIGSAVWFHSQWNTPGESWISIVGVVLIALILVLRIATGD